MSRRNTFVGGTCAPPSALLVGFIIIALVSILQMSNEFGVDHEGTQCWLVLTGGT